MDFSFSEEQEAVRELADRIFTDLATHERLREFEAEPDGDRFDRKLWGELAAAGLLGIALPEEVGGAGLGFVETGVLVEATGRTAAYVPTIETLAAAAAAIAEFGTEAQRQQWLPGVVSGDTVITTALVELGGTPAAPSVVAEQDGDGWVLSGTKACVPSGMVADAVLVTARVEPGSVAVFIVDMAAPGVSRERQVTNTGQPEAVLSLAATRVGPEALLGSIETGRGHRGVDGAANHRRPGAGPGRCGRGLPGPGGRVHEDPGAVRQAHRHVPGRGPTGRRRLRRHRGHPAHRLAGRLADRRGSAGRPARWPWPSSGPPTGASGWFTPPSTCTAGWAWTATTRCTATSS